MYEMIAGVIMNIDLHINCNKTSVSINYCIFCVYHEVIAGV